MAIINANRAACKLLEYSKTEILTQNKSSILSIIKKSFEFSFMQENMAKITVLGTALHGHKYPI